MLPAFVNKHYTRSVKHRLKFKLDVLTLQNKIYFAEKIYKKLLFVKALEVNYEIITLICVNFVKRNEPLAFGVLFTFQRDIFAQFINFIIRDD